ncbi:hypothetical protein ACA910_019699 [Epithemia clementina (nom. ined.)]
MTTEEEETTNAAAATAEQPQEEGGEDGGEDGGNAAAPAGEEESTATFEPVVKLEEVEVTSGEEDEEVIYSQRSKLYIFGETMLNKGTGNKTWIERGVGNMRILRHKERETLRVLMRQEKTLKIICNHIIDPQIQMVPHVQSDRSWIWVAFDFSDASLGELVETTFCIKFGDSDLAQAFKDKFQECQAKNKEVLGKNDVETKDAETEKAAEEATDALAGLTTKE